MVATSDAASRRRWSACSPCPLLRCTPPSSRYHLLRVTEGDAVDINLQFHLSVKNGVLAVDVFPNSVKHFRCVRHGQRGAARCQPGGAF
ncbi:Uncharacterised protein [Escherichia coli]|nr:Uncharacterised protein [Escherichia coli]